MSNSWFQFKQFRISQERSALKVGTDGVLLGAWCGVKGTKRILDVGTGTGLIALMLAQRSEALVDAVELSEDACADALLNFQKSPWEDRIRLFGTDFNDYSRSRHTLYDLVVCNPPYFVGSKKSDDAAITVAKHDVTLSFVQLNTGAKGLLQDNGRLAVIVPFDAFDEFRETARLAGFYLARKTVVVPKLGKFPKRVLLEFAVGATYPVVDELVVLQREGQYSKEFEVLTKDFYLNGQTA